jgi:pyruvate dehydrogenase E2 component (dihydrolipoamide acetyltransferase)
VTATEAAARAVEVCMPRLSDTMEEGTIVRWLADDGADVTRGQDLVEIETDKATMTYESGATGVLRIVSAEGATLAVGAAIAVIAAVGDSGESPIPPADPPRRGRLVASPVARRLAAELGIDIATVAGSGPRGQIRKADVERRVRGTEADATPETAPPSAVVSPGARGAVAMHELTRTQRTIARRMAESKATIPHFSVTADVDMTDAVRMREELRALDAATPLPSFNDIVIKACGIALPEHPRVRSAYRDGHLDTYSRINIGMAVASDDALIVPVIDDADARPLAEIALETRRLAERVRDGSITPPELAGAVFTVSNLGMYGVREFDAIVSVGQAAILSVGELAERPVVRDGQLVARWVMTATLSADHRVVYGADAARFLAAVREILERPLTLLLHRTS